LSAVDKIDLCLTELQELLNSSVGEAGSQSLEKEEPVPEFIQKSVFHLIKTVRSAMKGSVVPSLNYERSPSVERGETLSSGHVSVTEINETNPAEGKASSKELSGTSSLETRKKIVAIAVETQTDDTSYSGLLASMQTREEPEIARSEIGNLRDARMSLVNQRKDLSDKMKQVSCVNESNESGQEFRDLRALCNLTECR
jgi:hypothetical protein